MNKIKDKGIRKKSETLGIHYGTAKARLDRDIIFSFISKLNIKCFRCNGDLDRETFSVDHKNPWLIADDPLISFFDLENVAFSHSSCNTKAGRKPKKIYYSKEEKNRELHKKKYYNSSSKYNKENRKEYRKEYYKRTGK